MTKLSLRNRTRLVYRRELELVDEDSKTVLVTVSGPLTDLAVSLLSSYIQEETKNQ